MLSFRQYYTTDFVLACYITLQKAETLIYERYADNCETNTPVRCCRGTRHSVGSLQRQN